MNTHPQHTVTHPEYHAWKKAFKTDHGRDPTPYEAWVAGAEHGIAANNAQRSRECMQERKGCAEK
jgi:hypothetical protein